MKTSSKVDLQLSLLPNETLLWQKGSVIGSGRFGQVSLGLRIPTGDFLAVKQLFIQEEVDQGNDTSTLSMQRVLSLEKIEREVDIIQLLQSNKRHPNLIEFYGTERYGPLFNIFMEFMPYGSLISMLKDHGAFAESTIQRYVRQITAGVQHLHALGIAHRDLKCGNVLLGERGIVKISDFGTAKRTDDSGDQEDGADTARSVREGVGSPFWMAPEIVRAEKYDDRWQKADIWAIGCIVIEMATAQPPWDNCSNPLTAMFHIASEDKIPSLPSHLSATAHDFLLQCFQKDPRLRATADELLQHPFLNDMEHSSTVLVQRKEL